MSKPLTNQHPTGVTTGTAQRPGQPHSGNAMTFDLADEARRLRGEDVWQRNEHNARTLVKEQHLRVVALAMQAGGVVPQHLVEGSVTVHVLAGSVRVDADGRQIMLRPGNLLVLDYAIQFGIQAPEEAEILLTIVYGPSGDPAPATLFDAEQQA